LGAPSTTPAPIVPSDYNPVQAQDTARKNIAYALLGITALIIFGAFILASYALGANQPISENLKTVLALLNVVFGPIVALLGSATGFYFGANAVARGQQSRPQ
jgi:hypothetical protein